MKLTDKCEVLSSSVYGIFQLAFNVLYWHKCIKDIRNVLFRMVIGF